VDLISNFFRVLVALELLRIKKEEMVIGIGHCGTANKFAQVF
jgi:hypothetical protein